MIVYQVGAQDAFERAEGSDMSRHTARCTTPRQNKDLADAIARAGWREVDIDHIPRRRADHLGVVPRFRSGVS
jgi:lactam utilization protein B